MKTYHGYREIRRGHDGEIISSRCVVIVCINGRTRPLRPRNDIRNHSPTGFEWGYGGSGPAQLALALVADCCGAKQAEPPIYQRVKGMLVVGLASEGWTLTEEEVRAAATSAAAAVAATCAHLRPPRNT